MNVLCVGLTIGLGREVLDHDPNLLADGVRVEVYKRLEKVLGLSLVVVRVALHLLPQPPVRRVRRVAREDVEDEALLDRLPHAVKVEGIELAVGAARAEELKRFRLGCGGECEKAGVLRPTMHRRDLVDTVLLGRLLALFLNFGFFERASPQNVLDGLRAPLAGLRGVSLVNDQSEALARQLGDFLHGVDAKLLERGHDDRLAGLEGLLELTRGRVDVLDDAQRLLELTHRGLELPVEHAPVRDDYDRVENTIVGGVVEGGQLVREPRDGEALAAPGRVLNEVPLASARHTRMSHELADGVGLLVPRKDEVAFAGLGHFGSPAITDVKVTSVE